MTGTIVEVWCVRLKRNVEVLRRANALLTRDERRRAEAFHFQSLQDDFTLCRAALRELLSRLGCGAAEDLRFTFGTHGKPVLEGTVRSHVDFNISHSAGLLACAFTRDRDLGVDIERHRPLKDYQDIANRFFSPAEVAELLSLDPALREAAFYDCWVRKEAFVKALGGGLSIPLDSFRVSFAPGRPAALLDMRDHRDEARAWTIEAFAPGVGFSGAIACRDRDVSVRVHHVEIADVFAHA